MFDFKEDKQKSKEQDKEKLKQGIYAFMVIGLVLMIIGAYLIIPAFAVNQTAINEIQADLIDELDHGESFSVFWIIFLLIILAVFMLTAFARKTEREMVFFSIGAVIVSFMITLMFTAPISFDYMIDEKFVTVEEIEQIDNSITYNVAVTNQATKIQVIPPDSDFRLSLSVFFTGVALFNGLYAIMILTQFSTKGDIGIPRKY